MERHNAKRAEQGSMMEQDQQTTNETNLEKVFKELIEVLNNNNIDARTAIHLAQDIITNATLALLSTSKE
jgi:hypothetical protein